jgi:hypothetical protein
MADTAAPSSIGSHQPDSVYNSDGKHIVTQKVNKKKYGLSSKAPIMDKLYHHISIQTNRMRYVVGALCIAMIVIIVLVILLWIKTHGKDSFGADISLPFKPDRRKQTTEPTFIVSGTQKGWSPST